MNAKPITKAAERRTVSMAMAYVRDRVEAEGVRAVAADILTCDRTVERWVAGQTRPTYWMARRILASRSVVSK